MGKGKSWGPTQEAYVQSDLCAARERVAQLTGLVCRAAGLLGQESSEEALTAWCDKESARRRVAQESAQRVVGETEEAVA